MGTLQIRLQKWNERDKSLLCPQCGGRNCYKQYVYSDGTEVDPANHLCGKCDHESRCGYHLTPKEYFKTPGVQRKYIQPTNMRPAEQKQFIEIPRTFVAQTRRLYEQNNLVVWLRSLPWNEQERVYLEDVIYNFCVGTASGNRTIFWQVGADLKIRTGKIMLYDKETGHRVKRPDGSGVGFGWTHRKLFKDEQHELRQCLFGEHLLLMIPETCLVMLVESEKTALIMNTIDTLPMNRRVWLATGGMSNLTASKVEPLKGHTVLLVPDRGGEKKWKAKADEFGFRLYDGWIKSEWKEGVDPEGADIADVYIRKLLNRGPSLLERMQEQNPNLKKLVDGLQLIPA